MSPKTRKGLGKNRAARRVDDTPSLRRHFPSDGVLIQVPLIHERQGNALIEMSVTLPIILVLIIGTLDLGRAIYVQNVITNAAREGARYGTAPPIDLAAIEGKTVDYISGIDLNRVTVQATQPSSDAIRVTVTYTFTAITPVLGNLLGDNGTITLHGVSTMKAEGS